MPIKSYKLGPGTLTLGAGALEVSAQVTACTIAWAESVSTTEAIPVLSGEEIAAEDEATYAATASGSFVQDISTAGVVSWSWANKGTPQAFTFVPSTDEGREVTGTIIPVPLSIGGDQMKARPSSDFTWRFQGDPILGDAA